MKKLITAFVVSATVIINISNGFAQMNMGLSVQIAPPALLTYAQPPCPGDGYMWQPGYWAYGADGRGSQDYYWVPGVWVMPPQPGLYWTPHYWEFRGGFYRWHSGYWGATVGYYGGINYGYGYGGDGFGGGRWEGGRFNYNSAIMNVNTSIIHNTYVDRSVVRENHNRAKLNGPGGNEDHARSRGQAVANEQHVQPTNEQSSHHTLAGADHRQFSSVNHQNPGTVTMTSVHGTRFDQEGHEFTSPQQHHESEFQGAPHQQPGQGVERMTPAHLNASPRPVQSNRPRRK